MQFSFLSLGYFSRYKVFMLVFAKLLEDLYNSFKSISITIFVMVSFVSANNRFSFTLISFDIVIIYYHQVNCNFYVQIIFVRNVLCNQFLKEIYQYFYSCVFNSSITGKQKEEEEDKEAKKNYIEIIKLGPFLTLASIYKISKIQKNY